MKDLAGGGFRLEIVHAEANVSVKAGRWRIIEQADQHRDPVAAIFVPIPVVFRGGPSDVDSEKRPVGVDDSVGPSRRRGHRCYVVVMMHPMGVAVVTMWPAVRFLGYVVVAGVTSSVVAMT